MKNCLIFVFCIALSFAPFYRAFGCNKVIEVNRPRDLQGKTLVLPRNSRLEFSGTGKIYNGRITGNKTAIIVNGMNSVFGPELILNGSWKNDEIRMSWFDCYRDGVHSDLPVFQMVSRMISSNGGGHLVLEKNAVYCVDFSEDSSGGYTQFPAEGAVAFNFCHLNQVTVDMNGAQILMRPSHSTKYAFFLFVDCKKYELFNGKIVGDARNHDYSAVFYLNKKMHSSHEWGTGVIASGSSGCIHEMEISQMTGDGVLVGSVRIDGKTYHASSTISDVSISYCRRCGIGCGSSRDLKIINCDIHHIGTWDSVKGTSPQDGINLEYEDQVYDEGDILISGCTIRSCTEKTVSASNTTPPKPHDFKMESCTFDGAIVQIVNVMQSGKKNIASCVFTDAPIHLGDCLVENCSFAWSSSVNYIQGTSFTNCSFRGSLQNLVKPYGVCFAATSSVPAVFKNCTIRDIRGMNDSSPSVQGFSGYAFPIVAEFFDCVVENCSFVQGLNRQETRFSFSESELRKGCMFYNEAGNSVRFVDCVLDNVSSYHTQDGQFEMTRCKVIQTDKKVKNPLLLYGTHKMTDCTVRDDVGVSSQDKAKGVTKHRITTIKSKQFQD